VAGGEERDRVEQFVAALRPEAGRALRERSAFEHGSGENVPLVRQFEGIRIDTRDWPLLIMEMPEGSVNDEAVHGALACLEGIMAQTPAYARFFQVTDLSRMTRFSPASQRRYAGEWSRRTADLAKRARVGALIVAPSPMLRAIVSAVLWTKGAKGPSHVASTRAEGVLQAIRALEVAQPPLAPHLIALRERLEACAARHISSEGGCASLPTGS
jgi:hypothetical protein